MSRWTDEDIEALLGNIGSFEPRESIGQDYEVVELLGKGGQAEAYKVRNKADDRTYVAKIFVGDEQNRAFDHEQRILIALKGLLQNSGL